MLTIPVSSTSSATSNARSARSRPSPALRIAAVCAYKGVASYFSAAGAPDVASFYPDPLLDALPVKGLVSFRKAATVWVDGEAVDTSMPGEP